MGKTVSNITSGTIGNVIFDLCGVLVDWRPRRALEGLFPPEELDDFFADDDRCGFMYFDDLHDGGMDYSELIDAYEEEYGEHLAAMMRAYARHVDRSLTGTVPGMERLAADLRSAGVGVWGLTNWGRDTWPVMAARFPMLFDTPEDPSHGLLDDVMVSGIEGLKKPDAAVFELALTRFGIDRKRTAFVDDSPYNVDAARTAGLQAVRFTEIGRAHV